MEGWALLAALIAASVCWPLINQRWSQTKALRAQAQKLPEEHRLRYRGRFSQPLAVPLAMSGGYALCRGAQLDVFCFPDPEEERTILREAWDVFDARDAVQTIWWLLSEGHRTSWQRLRALVLAGGPTLAARRRQLGREARRNLEAREELVRMRRLERNERGVADLDFLAWDLSRAVMVARSAAACGYLEREVAQDIAVQAASFAQQSYESWDDFGRSFDVSRWFWLARRNPLDDAHDAHRTAALSSPDGPYTQVDLHAPLPDAQQLLFEAAGELSLSLRAAAEDRAWQRALVAEARART